MFKKKDGTIKDRYMGVCVAIVNSYRYIEEISRGRSDEIIERNECFHIQHRERLSKNREIFISKVKEICNEYGYEIRVWYGACGDFSIDIMSTDISKMISELKELIGGELQ